LFFIPLRSPIIYLRYKICNRNKREPKTYMVAVYSWIWALMKKRRAKRAPNGQSTKVCPLSCHIFVLFHTATTNDHYWYQLHNKITSKYTYNDQLSVKSLNGRPDWAQTTGRETIQKIPISHDRRQRCTILMLKRILSAHIPPFIICIHLELVSE